MFDERRDRLTMLSVSFASCLKRLFRYSIRQKGQTIAAFYFVYFLVQDSFMGQDYQRELFHNVLK